MNLPKFKNSYSLILTQFGKISSLAEIKYQSVLRSKWKQNNEGIW